MADSWEASGFCIYNEGEPVSEPPRLLISCAIDSFVPLSRDPDGFQKSMYRSAL